MRGRKPIPSAIRAVRGNPGKRTGNEREPEFAAAIPGCPAHLDGEARAEWDRVAKELHDKGVLAQVDRAALACYCQAWGRLCEAEVKVRDMGLVLEGEKGSYQNPWLFVANKAMEQIKAFAAEFGMTPSSRTRVKAGRKETDSPLARLLKRRASPN
jgi:P27 family predicted phage terminase small subunit